jgi:hypothetical protein
MSALVRFLSGAGGMLLMPVFVIGVVFWEIATPPSLSLIANLYETLGYGHAKATAIRTEAEAKYEHEIRLAVAEVDRVTHAYNGLWNSYNGAISASIAWEGQLLSRQVSTISTSQIVPQVVTNVAELGCALSHVAKEPESKIAMASACAEADRMREDMVADYATLIPAHRTNLTQDMIASFPQPTELLSSEYARVAAKYGSE